LVVKKPSKIGRVFVRDAGPVVPDHEDDLAGFG